MKLVIARSQGWSLESTIRELESDGFLDGGNNSPRYLYERIKEDGHPICPVCGTTYVDENHCKSSSGTRKKPRRRKAKKFGPVTPLPSPERAIARFKATLERLIKELDTLRGRDEYLQSGRFTAVSEKDGEKKVWGAGQAPPEPLTTLIAIDALVAGYAGNPRITQLIDALHPSELIEEHSPFRGGILTERNPDPQKVNLRDLDVRIKELRKCAEDVAKLIRGLEEIGPGRRTDEIPPRDIAVIDLVERRAKEGYSDEQIREEVNRRYDRGPLGALSLHKDFTLEDIRELREYPFKGGVPFEKRAP